MAHGEVAELLDGDRALRARRRQWPFDLYQNGSDYWLLYQGTAAGDLRLVYAVEGLASSYPVSRRQTPNATQDHIRVETHIHRPGYDAELTQRLKKPLWGIVVLLLSSVFLLLGLALWFRKQIE